MSRGSKLGSSARIRSTSGGCVANQLLKVRVGRSNIMWATSSVSTETMRAE
jgi:hypothetical protein